MQPKLSIVILCWNDTEVIHDAIRSIYEKTKTIDFEIIVSDNGSAEGCVSGIRAAFPFPSLHIVENRANLGFARGNNAGIAVAQGDYILILNPDTWMHEGTLDKFVEFADQHPAAGAFGCRVVYPDGRYQPSAMLAGSVRRFWMLASGLNRLARFCGPLHGIVYPGWHGNSAREVDWQSGCCVMFRGKLLKQLGGFDPQFFYQNEEVDLCKRVWDVGYKVLFTPSAQITHIGGQSVKRARTRLDLETHRSRYKYFYKHFGSRGASQVRYPILLLYFRRWLIARIVALLRPSETNKAIAESLAIQIKWNYQLNPVRFAEFREEPDLGFPPMSQLLAAPAANTKAKAGSN
jgi:GT2 family glycosyltransferase